MKSEVVYILLGSNLGNREETIARARTMIDSLCGVMITAESAVYESAAVEMQTGTPSFLNQVVECTCVCEPMMLLKQLEGIETLLGRSDKGNYQSRTIDLDILLFGERQMDNNRLTIPHKRLTERPFALVPLLDVAPNVVHPETGNRMAEYLEPEESKSVRAVNTRFAGMHG